MAVRGLGLNPSGVQELREKPLKTGVLAEPQKLISFLFYSMNRSTFGKP